MPQHRAGGQTVPCSYSCSDSPTTSTKPAEMAHILRNNSRILRVSLETEQNRFASGHTDPAALKALSCITQGFQCCSQLHHLWILGVPLRTHSYAWERDLVCISPSALYSIPVTRDPITLVTQGRFTRRAESVQHQIWACCRCRRARKKTGFGRRLIEVACSCHVSWDSTNRSDLVPAWPKTRPDGTETVRKAKTFGCQCQTNTNTWSLHGFQQRKTLPPD